jgi:lysophospholipase L1-like esterase
MSNKIQVKRGVEANLPTLDIGEPALTTDTNKPFFGTSTGNLELATKQQINDLVAKTVVTLNHQFADATTRDTYFTAHPTELVDKLFIKVGTGYQQYIESAWQGVSAVVTEQLTANLQALTDVGNYFTNKNTEGALQEVASELDTLTTNENLLRIETDNPSVIYPKKNSKIKVAVTGAGATANVIHRGKNWFDGISKISNAFIDSGKILAVSGTACVYAPCLPNTLYTISKLAASRFLVGYTTALPAINVSVFKSVYYQTEDSITIKTGADAVYLVAYVYRSASDTGITEAQMVASVQIEFGEYATERNDYIAPVTREVTLIDGKAELEIDALDGCNVVYTDGTGINIEYDKIQDVILSEVENASNTISQKHILLFGDSIIGWVRDNTGVAYNVKQRTKAMVDNVAFAGCYMSQIEGSVYDAFSMYKLADAIATGDYSLQYATAESVYAVGSEYHKWNIDKISNADWSSQDTVMVIAYGTNDFQHGNVLDNDLNPLDYTTFGGAIRYSIEKIWSVYPAVKIVLVSPHWRFYQTSGVYTSDSDTFVNSTGKTLIEFIELEKAIAKAYHIPFIDNYFELGIHKFNRTNYFDANDGTHHIANGRKLIGERIGSKLANFF